MSRKEQFMQIFTFSFISNESLKLYLKKEIWFKIAFKITNFEMKTKPKQPIHFTKK